MTRFLIFLRSLPRLFTTFWMDPAGDTYACMKRTFRLRADRVPYLYTTEHCNALRKHIRADADMFRLKMDAGIVNAKVDTLMMMIADREQELIREDRWWNYSPAPVGVN